MIALWLWLSPAWAGPGDEPLDRYLEAEELRAALVERAPDLAACGAGLPDGAWRLGVQVAGSGAFEVVSVTEADAGPPPDGLQPCLSAALAARPLPPHDEPTAVARGTVLVRSGEVSLGPVIEVDEHQADLLFLHLPPDLEPARRREILRLLGLDTPVQPGRW